VGNYCYVAVCSAALGASAPTEGGEGRGHIVAATRLQLVLNEWGMKTRQPTDVNVLAECTKYTKRKQEKKVYCIFIYRYDYDTTNRGVFTNFAARSVFQTNNHRLF